MTGVLIKRVYIAVTICLVLNLAAQGALPVIKTYPSATGNLGVQSAFPYFDEPVEGPALTVAKDRTVFQARLLPRLSPQHGFSPGAFEIDETYLKLTAKASTVTRKNNILLKLRI